MKKFVSITVAVLLVAGMVFLFAPSRSANTAQTVVAVQPWEASDAIVEAAGNLQPVRDASILANTAHQNRLESEQVLLALYDANEVLESHMRDVHDLNSEITSLLLGASMNILNAEANLTSANNAFFNGDYFTALIYADSAQASINAASTMLNQAQMKAATVDAILAGYGL